MYSSDIIARRLFQVKKATGLDIQKLRLPRERSIEIADKLQKLRYDSKGALGAPGWLGRPLDSKEQSFIETERLLCKADFAYYAQRYHKIGVDTGTSETEETIAPVQFQESQRRLLRAMGKREEEVHAEYAKYKFTEGIRIIAHKTRQQYYTAISRMLTLHRMLFWPGTRALAAALNPKGVGELYKRDKLAIDNLPWWLMPEIYPDVKDEEIGFKHPLESRLMYQAENEKSGLAVGTTQDVSHLTEVPLWSFPAYNIGFSLMAAIPKTRQTLHIQEGTSAGGHGYWREVSEACRNKDEGWQSWTYVFIPWWTNVGKFRSIPPAGWQPKKHTQEHVEMVERTSPEWNDGATYRLTMEQAYWWESTRAQYVERGSLGAFLATYPATPEESFTQWSKGALPTELIEKMAFDERRPNVYSVEVVN